MATPVTPETGADQQVEQSLSSVQTKVVRPNRKGSATPKPMPKPPKGMERLTSLKALPKEIRQEHEAIVGLLGDIVPHAVAAGEKLLFVKALQQRNFQTWCANNLKGISERTIQVYMRVASPQGQAVIAAAKAQHAAPLSLRSIIGALTTPKAVKAKEVTTDAPQQPATPAQPIPVQGELREAVVNAEATTELQIGSVISIIESIVEHPENFVSKRHQLRKQLAEAREVIDRALLALAE